MSTAMSSTRLKDRMEGAHEPRVQPAWDGWRAWWDQRSRPGLGGVGDRTNREGVPVAAIYFVAALVVIAACTVDAFSVNYDLTKIGRAHRVWEPIVWEGSSGIVILALLALPRRAAGLAGTMARRPLLTGAALAAIVLAFSALHIVGMVLLRKLAYAIDGTSYTFGWTAGNILYEFRKDLLSFSVIAIMFWLAERAFGPAGRAFGRGDGVAPQAVDGDEPGDAEPRQEPVGHELWLRDGRTSLLIDARDVVWVASAGNYVEYAMGSGPRHLIRSTLRDEEARLSRFGMARVHRTRLINLRRVVAITWRKSGDFELRLDTGESVMGSRRHRGAITGLA
jgi:hypothetical protein